MALNLEGAKRVVDRLTFVDDCIVHLSADTQQEDKVWDDELGDYLPGPASVPQYVGRCNISPERLQPGTENVGGTLQTELRYNFSVPPLLALFEEESIVEITAVHENGDLNLVGKFFTITSPNVGTYIVSRMYRATRYVPPTA